MSMQDTTGSISYTGHIPLNTSANFQYQPDTSAANTANCWQTWPATSTYTWSNMTYSLSDAALEQIRKVVAEEIDKALSVDEPGESITAELVHDGKRYKGTLYLVEEEEA